MNPTAAVGRSILLAGVIALAGGIVWFLVAYGLQRGVWQELGAIQDYEVRRAVRDVYVQRAASYDPWVMLSAGVAVVGFLGTIIGGSLSAHRFPVPTESR